jgi:hypothetical protein
MMRKRLYATLLLLICAAVLGCSKDGKRPYRIGLVNFVTGKVLIIGAGGKVFPAEVGLPVDEGMKIKTEGKGSLCELYIKETAVKIFSDATVDFSRLGYDRAGGERTSINLQGGTLFIRVARKLSKNDSFVIKTPTLVAAVRGTEFFVSGRNLSCLDGKMEVKSPRDKASITIEDGEAVQPSAGKSAKKKIDDSTARKLSKDAEVKPVEKINSELFAKLDAGDAAALRKLRAKVKTMSGGDVKKDKKEDKPDIDIFFFKS